MPNLYVALAHYPVVNKNGKVITSAVTNLDLHDIARAAKTYGVRSFYVVTPLADQKALVEKIVSHWTSGTGAQYNPIRRRALDLIHIEDSIEAVVEHIINQGEGAPKTVVTCARDRDQSLSFGSLRAMLHEAKPYLLIFGTAWGLSEQCINEADYILEPIKGDSDYNHLSVRSALSIILDRLMGSETRG
jgi:hypothetical protein